MTAVIFILTLAALTAIYGASHTGSRVMRADGDGGSNSGSDGGWDFSNDDDLPF